MEKPIETQTEVGWVVQRDDGMYRSRFSNNPWTKKLSESLVHLSEEHCFLYLRRDFPGLLEPTQKVSLLRLEATFRAGH